MANLFQPSLSRITDSNGDPVPNARMYFYLTGTTTPATWFTDQAGTTPGTNPLTADSSGKFTTPAYLDDATTYRIRVTDASGTQLWPDADPVRGYDTGMVQTAAESAATSAATATTQAGIATTQAGLAATARTGAETAETNAETAQGLAEDARDAAEDFRDEAEAQADLATTAATTGTLRIQTNPATPTTPPSGAGDGEQYWVVDADATKLTLYLNTSGTGAAVSVGGDPVEMPLQPALDAVLEPVAPADITGTRTLTGDDARKTLLANIPAPTDDVVAPIKVPSNSEDALPIGTTFKLVRTGGARIRPVSDDVGDAVILGTERDLAADEGLAFVEKVATNNWRFYGETEAANSAVIDPGTHEVFADFSDFDTLRQDVAGTIPVTAVGQTVCWAANKGTKGGQFVAPSDSRGYTLEIVDGVYMLVPAAADSCFRLAAAAGINLAELDMFIGLKVFTPLSNMGVVSFQSSTNTAVGQNDGLYFNMSAPGYAFGLRAGSPAAIASAAGYIGKYPHVIELHKPGNSAPFRILIDNSWETTTNPSATVTSLGTLARDLILGAMQANNPEGVGQFGDVGFTCIVGGGAILTTDQSAQARAFVESKTYGTVPNYPALTTLAQVEAARDVLNDQLYSGGGIPTEIGTISVDSSPRLPSTTNVAAFEKITMSGYTRVPRVYTPNSARTDVFVIEIEGHATVIGGNGNSALIQDLMNVNVPTVAIVLPDGPNDYTSGAPSEHDAAMDSLDEWTGPVSIAINTMLDRYPGAMCILTGISGGGMASVLCAASDARIATSLSIVGWIPEYFHLNRDHEQGLPGISAGFMDLALMAAADEGRCISRLHRLDAVGFGDVVLATRPDFMPVLGDMATALDGTFIVTKENVSPHAYSTADRAAVLAELP